jgi:hypothetical protein
MPTATIYSIGVAIALGTGGGGVVDQAHPDVIFLVPPRQRSFSVPDRQTEFKVGKR